MVIAMSSLNVDSALFEQTKAIATAQGMTVEQYVEEALRQAVGKVVPHKRMRNGLPVMVVNGKAPAIDPRVVRQSLEEYGF
jgi:hypothetical protein